MKSHRLSPGDIPQELVQRARNASIAVTFLLCLVMPTTLDAGREDDTNHLFGTGVRAVAFSPDGALLAAAVGESNQRGRLVLWTVAGRKELWAHEESRNVVSVAFSPDSRTMAISVDGRTPKLVDTNTGKVIKVLRGHNNWLRAVAFSPDGKTLATGGWDVVKVWDLATGAEKLSLQCASSARPFSLSYSPSSKWLMAAANEATVWDALTGQETRTVKEYYPRWAVFANDSSFFTGDRYGTIRLWDIATGRQLLRFHAIDRIGVARLAYSPRARLLAESSFGKSISLFEFTLEPPTPPEAERIRALLLKLDADNYDVRDAASKDLLAVGFVAEPELRRNMNAAPSPEVRIRCRQIREELLRKPCAQLYGHTGPVEGLAFAPDGRILASGSRDGSVRLWNVRERKEVARLVPRVMGQ